MGRRLAASHTFRPFERDAQTAGYRYIAGIDEAGRGPLAGPVVAAAVILCPGDTPVGLQDSKRLTAHQRETVFPDIHHRALAYGIGIVTHDQIDRHNILWATKQAMMQAIRQLTLGPELLLIDGSQGCTHGRVATDDRWRRCLLCLDCGGLYRSESHARSTDERLCPTLSALRF